MIEENAKKEDQLNEEMDISEAENINLEDPQEMPDPEALPEEGGDELEKLVAERDELKDKLLRTMAEMENVRRRAEREKVDAAKFGVSSLAKNLLTVADNLSRALDAAPEEAVKENDHFANLITGVEATRSELMKTFEAMGIKPVRAELGQAFDPNLHEVMFEGPSDEYAGGSIMQVLESGYTIHDRLLRPARVGVVKKSADQGDTVNVKA